MAVAVGDMGLSLAVILNSMRLGGIETSFPERQDEHDAEGEHAH